MTTTDQQQEQSAPAFDIPGPRPMPIIGPTRNVFRYLRDPIHMTGHLFRRYGRLTSPT